MSEQSVNSILLIRLSAIGDVVMASGLIALLRERYPQARLSWLVQPEAKDVLAAHPALTEVIVWPRAHWRRLARRFQWWQLLHECIALIKTLRARRFDLAIDMQGLLKSGLWARASGARERVGLGSREGSARFMTRVIDKPARSASGDKNIASEYRHLAQALGLNAPAYRMHIGVTPEDERFAQTLRQRHGVPERYIVVCPFTTRPQKHWFESNWLAAIGALRTQFGMPVLLLGGPGDRAAAAPFAAAQVVDVVGETSLSQAAALIRGAALLVGVDTALTHMGSAFEIPTIVLFGSTFPYTRTDSPRTQVLYHKLDCSPCKRHPTCGGVFTCMRLIGADEVVQTARRLLP